MKTGRERKKISVYSFRHFVKHLVDLSSTKSCCADIGICRNNLMSALREFVMCSRCNMSSAAEIRLTNITSNTWWKKKQKNPYQTFEGFSKNLYLYIFQNPGGPGPLGLIAHHVDIFAILPQILWLFQLLLLIKVVPFSEKRLGCHLET